MSEPPTTTSFEARIVLRPRTLDETFDLSLVYARAYSKDFARALLVSVGTGLSILAALKIAFALTWFQTWAVAFVLSPLIERAMTVYAGSHLFGNRPRLLAGLTALLRRPLVSLLSSVLIPLPLLPALIDGFDEPFPIVLAMMTPLLWPFLLARNLYFSQVGLLENLPTGAAIKRSGTLTNYRYGRALAFVTSSTIARAGAALTADLAVGFLVSFVLQLGEPLDTLFDNGGSWASLAGFLAAAPLLAVARLFDYVDARTRLEGWDIQVRFKAIAAKARQERVSQGAAA